MHLVFIVFVSLSATGLVSLRPWTNTGVMQPRKKQCGYLPPNQRSRQLIESGNIAGHWPWQAYITQKNVTAERTNFKGCGGTIINREWILTAAGCLYPMMNASDYCVVVGHKQISGFLISDLRNNCSVGQRPLQIIRHPKFDVLELVGAKLVSEATRWFIKHHDIGLIKMELMSFNTPDIGHICLPTGAGNYYDQNCTIAGWGVTETGKESNDLKSLRSQIWSKSKCRTQSSIGKTYDGPRQNPADNFYCFGEANEKPCSGDNGGALSCKNSMQRFEAVGVMASFTTNRRNRRCPGETSYFIPVQTHLKWIKDTVKANTAQTDDIFDWIEH